MTDSDWALPRCVSCGAEVADPHATGEAALLPAERCPVCGLIDPANPANRVWRENGGHNRASFGAFGGDVRSALGHGR